MINGLIHQEEILSPKMFISVTEWHGMKQKGRNFN